MFDYSWQWILHRILFSSSEACHTDVFGYILFLHDTWWPGTSMCPDLFFTRNTKTQVFQHNIQATIYLPSFAEGDCRHHYRNLHDTWGFWHMTVVTSGESHPHLLRNFIGNYFDQRYRSGVLVWGQQNSWPTKTRFLDMDIDVNFGVGHLLNGKWKADTKPLAELGFLPRSLGKWSINFMWEIIWNWAWVQPSSSWCIKFENIQFFRHRNTFLCFFYISANIFSKITPAWGNLKSSNRLLMEVGCF